MQLIIISRELHLPPPQSPLSLLFCWGTHTSLLNKYNLFMSKLGSLWIPPNTKAGPMKVLRGEYFPHALFVFHCCPCRGTDDRYFIKAMIRMWKCLAVARTAKCIMLLINVALSSNVFLSLHCLSHCYPAVCLRPFIFVLPSATRFHFSLRGNDPSRRLVLAQTHRLARGI